MPINNATNLYGVAKWIVDPVLGSGTHTTITAAIAAASSGDTIFIRTGTYTENPTLKAGVNLTAFGCDGIASGQGNNVIPNVIIKGTTDISIAGTVSISGIQFLTNGSAAITNSGSNISNVIFTNCSVNANDATGMSLSGSLTNWTFYTCCFNSASTNNLFDCYGNIEFISNVFGLSATATASTISTASVLFNACDMSALSIVTASTGSVRTLSCEWGYGGQILLTTAGTGASLINGCSLTSNAASTISIGTGTTVTLTHTSISSSNTNVITGAGTLNYAFVAFTGTSSGHNVTTENALATLI